MKKLSSATQLKAVEFFKNEARPLEQKCYAYWFEGGSQADVLAALGQFQNPDGGFGHALEPDLRLSDSSVIATTIAFQWLREIHVPADHPVVINGCRYLRDTYDAAHVNWPIIPPNADDAPHAPWWVYGGDLSHSLSNPRAAIAGYLYDYAEHFPAAMRQQVTDAVVDHLLTQPDQMEIHDLQCYLGFHDTSALPETVRARLFDKLKRIVSQVVNRNPAEWGKYGLTPLSVVSRLDSPFESLFHDLLDANLDFVIDQQDKEGYWSPNWSWEDLWPTAWAQAECDWRGVLSLHSLRILQVFGRLE